MQSAPCNLQGENYKCSTINGSWVSVCDGVVDCRKGTCTIDGKPGGDLYQCDDAGKP